MSPLDAVWLGLIQGFSEFLPISSSGHLVLAQRLLGVRLPGMLFEVTVHVGTLCAVLWVYRARLAELAVGVLRADRDSLRYAGLLALATVPATLLGLTAVSVIEPIFEKPVVAAALLLVSGGLAWSVRFTAPKADKPAPEVGGAVWIGAAQALAILPGISRSGATLAVGVGLGVQATRMAEFSFLMSIPVIAGAGALKLPDAVGVADTLAVPLLIGFVAACLSGVAAIRIFLRMLRGDTFHRFAYYCWTIGVAYLVAAALVPALRS